VTGSVLRRLFEIVDAPDVEIVLEETRQAGAPVASFVAAVRLDAHGRIDRYIVGRSTAVLFELA
jgi:hypothetical protein